MRFQKAETVVKGKQDQAGRKGQGMKEKIVEILLNSAAAISIFGILFFLYILMAALG